MAPRTLAIERLATINRRLRAKGEGVPGVRAAPTPRRRGFLARHAASAPWQFGIARRISQARRDVVVVRLGAPAKRQVARWHCPGRALHESRRGSLSRRGTEAGPKPRFPLNAIAQRWRSPCWSLRPGSRFSGGLALLTALFAALILLLVAILIALVLRLVALLLVLVDLTAALLLVAHRSLPVSPPDRRLAGERSVRRMVPGSARRRAGSRARLREISENPASCRHVERFRRCRFRVRGARPGADGDAAIFARLRRMAHDDG